ncbi:putative actin patch assembly and actin polymerization protein [Puccinia graminis f. sp. tritici]|uniref:Putative actin patch assembly and actin polymerization protein n=1 Tax=Puccinia graminis f. sp. tritici TaxID=56615 RepID=A0A5B0N0Y1_PUCGR|nr:putative actin patch assembly and actin polymerization protein [Puccinia graminis f. sp. tritici]
MPSLFSDPTKAKELDSAQNDLNGFIIELVESINLQPLVPRSQSGHPETTQTWPADSTGQGSNILEALVLNGGSRFKLECFKGLVSDPRTDSKVRRRLLIMMEDWEKAYGSDANMIVAASLFKTCGGRAKLEKLSPSSSSTQRKTSTQRSMITGIERASIDRPGANPSISKAQLKMQKARQKTQRKAQIFSYRSALPTELVLPASDSSSLLAFDLIKEKPRILQAVASASQSANNLVNRLQLIGPDQVARDLTVGGLVEKAKASQKALIRYIQIVSEHDSEGEYLGTLLNTNAQVVTA